MADIREIIKGTQARTSRLQRLLFITLWEYLTDNLSIEGSRVLWNSSNIGAVNRLSVVSNRVSPTVRNVIAFIVRGILSGVEDTIFQLNKQDQRAIQISSPVLTRVRNHAATTVQQKADLSAVYEQIKDRALGLMSRYQGISLKELREDLQGYIVDDKLVERYYNRWTYDIFTSYQNAAGNEIRQQLGLRFAMYTGGIIEASRNFCIEKEGKVFSEEEIKAWQDQDWKGKPEAGYDPFIDLGGYNCRHTLSWISDELAFELRPELKELYELV